MANINGTGAPSRKTRGAIGDIYTDSNSGQQYKCTFAYCSNGDDDFDCEWRQIKGCKTEIPKPSAKIDIPKEKEKIVQQSNNTPNKSVKEENVSQKRTNYSAYSNKKNR